ncbi:MAG: 30S ribosomal protein S9 [Planctomycetota bacterium]
MPQGPVYLGTGRRKKAVARVRLFRGGGDITVNGHEAHKYFPNERALEHGIAPLEATKMLTRYDVTARCDGGGFSGQAGALRLGIARALLKADNSLEGTLRDRGFLTRDPRQKERRKYGRRGARAGFQYSKR